MDNEAVKQKYGITKRIAVMLQVQMCLVGLGMVITLYGVTQSTDSVSRMAVYLMQAIICAAILIFGLFLFKKKDVRIFKSVVILYAALEAVRCALLRTGGVDTWSAVLARLLLVGLACCAAVLAEHLGEEKYNSLGYLIVFQETALYLVFTLGFPGVETRLLHKILPLAGVLIAASIVLFCEAKVQQAKYLGQDLEVNADEEK